MILDQIVEDARDRSLVATAGDYNAWAVEWSSKKTKKREQTLLEAFLVLAHTLVNDGRSQPSSEVQLFR